MAITTLPTPPSRSDPANFSANGDAFLGALPNMVTEINATSASMDSTVSAAAASAIQASESADAALANAGAIKWVSGTTYAIGDVRWSPANFLSYRRKTAGAGTTDPSTDTTNWADIIIRKNMVKSTRTSNTILGIADANTLVDITSGTFSQTFTAAATLASGWYITIRNSGAGVITLDPNGSETIDGLTTIVMYPNEARLVQCDGSSFTSIVQTPFRFISDLSGSFVWPPGYSSFDITLSGAGGGGSGGGGAGSGTTNSSTGRSGNGGAGGAGGCGGQLVRRVISRAQVSPGTSVSYTIGAGGAGGPGGTGGAAAATAFGNTGTIGSVGSAGGSTSLGVSTDLFYMIAPGGSATDSGSRGTQGYIGLTAPAAVANGVALLTTDINISGAIRGVNSNGGTSGAGGVGQASSQVAGAGGVGGITSTSNWLYTGASGGSSGAAGSTSIGNPGGNGGTPAQAPPGCGGGGGGGGGGTAGAVASGTSGKAGDGGAGGIGGNGRLEIWGNC